MKDTIKQKILELVPDAKEDFGIAVVLRAIHKAHKYLAVGNTGQFMDASLPIPDELPFWNLEHDNYDQQSEECKQFIGSLLGV